MNAEIYGVGQQAIHLNRFSAELRKAHHKKTTGDTLISKQYFRFPGLNKSYS